MNQKIILSIILVVSVVAILWFLGLGIVPREEAVSSPSASSTVSSTTSTTPLLIATGTDSTTKPPAPGPWAGDAVRNLQPQALKTGDNTVTAEVRGYMFFEGVTHLALYDGAEEIDLGTRPDGRPNTVVTAEGDWMTTGYVPISTHITIPAELKGKTLTIRFIADDPRGDAHPRYWGTLIAVK